MGTGIPRRCTDRVLHLYHGQPPVDLHRCHEHHHKPRHLLHRLWHRWHGHLIHLLVTSHSGKDVMAIHRLYVSIHPIENPINNPSIRKHHDISHNCHDRRRHHSTRTGSCRSRRHKPLPRLLSSLQYRLRFLRPRGLLRPNGRAQEPKRLHKIPLSPARHRHGPVHHRRVSNLPVRRRRRDFASAGLRLADGRENRVRHLAADYHHRRCHQRPRRVQVCLPACFRGYGPHAQA